MRIAVSTSVLRVPPTYFVVEHARQLAHIHDFHAFALAADIRDQTLALPVTDSLGLGLLPIGARMRLAPLSIPRLGRQIVSFRPDLIHQHFSTWSGPAIAASTRLSVPLMTTLHGYDVYAAGSGSHHPLAVWHRHNIRASQEHSHRLLAVSSYLANEAVIRGFPTERMHVHYQGVDTDFFTPGVQPRDSTELPIVLFVGGLAPNKGVFDLIKASRNVASSTPHRLVMIGAGPLASQLHEETFADSHIDLLGSRSRAEVRDWMRTATVTVLPSLPGTNGAREAAGLVLLESQSCGTPVLAYRSGGTPEMLIEEETGVLVSEHDVAALGSKIRDFVELTSAQHMKMSTRARDYVVKSRSSATSSRELDWHYQDLVGSETL